MIVQIEERRQRLAQATLEAQQLNIILENKVGQKTEVYFNVFFVANKYIASFLFSPSWTLRLLS
jgi:hypothetical protein